MFALLDNRNELGSAFHKAYWEFYGMHHDPFQLNESSKLSYLPPRWEQYFDLLHYLCRTNNVLLAITGVKASGKTTFLQQFISQLEDTTYVCQIVASSDLSPAVIVQTMMRDFSLPKTPEDSIDEQLDVHLANLQHYPKPCLLVMDNAHLLSSESLSILLYIVRQQSETQMRLHVLLTGLPELKDKLMTLVNQEDEHGLIDYLELGIFSREETESYILHHLKNAGLPAALPLNMRNLDQIFQVSSGYPQQINIHTARTLKKTMQYHRYAAMIDYCYINRRGLLLILMITLSIIILLIALIKV